MIHAKTVELLEIPSGGQTCVDSMLKEPCMRWGMYGRHLANTIERFVLGGLTLTLLYHYHNVLLFYNY